MVCDNLGQMNDAIVVESDITKVRGRLNRRLGVLFALVVMTTVAALPLTVKSPASTVAALYGCENWTTKSVGVEAMIEPADGLLPATDMPTACTAL